MLSTRLTELVDSLRKETNKNNSLRICTDIQAQLRCSNITCGDRKELAQNLKECLRNSGIEEQKAVLQTLICCMNEELPNLIVDFCDGNWPDSITGELFSLLIITDKFDIEKCLSSSVRSKILRLIKSISTSIQSPALLQFIHQKMVRSIFETEDDNVRIILCQFVIVLSSNFGIDCCDQEKLKEMFIRFKNRYVPLMEDLRKKDNRIWYRLCMFTFNYFGKLIHTDVDLINSLLSNIEKGFKSKSLEDKLLSYDCWKVLIDVSNLDFGNSKQMKLITKLLNVKLSRSDDISYKRLEVWLHLLSTLQKNSTNCLEDFMNVWYQPLSDDSLQNGCPVWSEVTKKSWRKLTEALINLIGHHGHVDSCIVPESFKLNEPVITSANLLKYKRHVLNAIDVCSECMMFWEEKCEREKKIKCLWGSLFNIIAALDSLAKELVLNDVFAVLKRLFEKSEDKACQDYFDDVLQHVFIVVGAMGEETNNAVLLNKIIVFPFAQIMIGCSEILEYKAIAFVQLLRKCSKTGSRLDYFNTSCDLLKSCTHCSTQILSAYLWLELANELLSICKSPKDQFEDFEFSARMFMSWICQCYIPEQLKNKTLEVWKSILIEINVMSDVFKESVLKDIGTFLKENPSLANFVLDFLPVIVDMINEKCSLSYVSACLYITLECLKSPCLPSTKLVNVLPIITKVQTRTNLVKTDEDVIEPIQKLYECVECFLKPHQVFETLRVFKTALSTFPQSSRRKFPQRLHTIINDLIVHSDSTTSKDAVALLAELEKEQTTNPSFTKPNISTRTAKIARMTKGFPQNDAPLAAFVQEMLKSPVPVKGSQINNQIQRSSRAVKIANAMPKFVRNYVDVNLDNSSDFVFIDKEVKIDSTKFSAHQKEAHYKRREDIPALYQDLSQSEPSKSSTSSQDTLDFNNVQDGDNDKKTGNDLLDKLAASAVPTEGDVGDILETKDAIVEIGRIDDGGNEIPRSESVRTNEIKPRRLCSSLILKDPVHVDTTRRSNSDTNLNAETADSKAIGVVSKLGSLSVEEITPKRQSRLRLNETNSKSCVQTVSTPILDISSSVARYFTIDAGDKIHRNNEQIGNESVVISTKEDEPKLQGLLDIHKTNVTLGIGDQDEFGSKRKYSPCEKLMGAENQIEAKVKSKKKRRSSISKINSMLDTGGQGKSSSSLDMSSIRTISANVEQKNDIEKLGGELIVKRREELSKLRRSPRSTKGKKEKLVQRSREVNVPKATKITTSLELMQEREEGREKTRTEVEISLLCDRELSSEINNLNDIASTEIESLTLKSSKEINKPESDAIYDKNTSSENLVEIQKIINSTQKEKTFIDKKSDVESVFKDNENDTIVDVGDSKITEDTQNTTQSQIPEKADAKLKRIQNELARMKMDIVGAENFTSLRGTRRRSSLRTKHCGELPCCKSTPNIHETKNSRETNADVSGLRESKTNKSVVTKRSRAAASRTATVNSLKRRESVENSLVKEIDENATEKSIVASSEDFEKFDSILKNIHSDLDANKQKYSVVEQKSELDPSEAVVEGANPSPIDLESNHGELADRAPDNNNGPNTNSLELGGTGENSESTLFLNYGPIFDERTDKIEPIKSDSDSEGSLIGNCTNNTVESKNDSIGDDEVIESSQPVQLTTPIFNRSIRKVLSSKDLKIEKINDINDLLELSPIEKANVNEELIDKYIERNDGLQSSNLKNVDVTSKQTKNDTVEETNSVEATESCNPDETIISIKQLSIEGPLPKTKNLLLDLDIDALPTGLGSFDENNLPGSPVCDDTMHRNTELLNSTLDISPIKTKDDQETENSKSQNDTNRFEGPSKCNLIKSPSSRSERLMNMLPTSLKISKSPKSSMTFSPVPKHANISPAVDRIRRMIRSAINSKVAEPSKQEQKTNDDILQFTREIPSPLATPNGSILKRKASDATEHEAPTPKRKRVNFSDPPTTCEKIYYKDADEGDSSDGGVSVVSELNVRKSNPIYPTLTECTIDIKEVLNHMRQDNLYEQFALINVKTVGDLAKLNSTQVNQLDFLSNPRLASILSGLSAFAGTLTIEKKNDLQEKLYEPEITSTLTVGNTDVSQDSEDNTQILPEDYIQYLPIANSRSKALRGWDYLKSICTQDELQIIEKELKVLIKKE